jgi:hypothetical protein
MLENELAAAQADYCDPYCRKIVDVKVVSTSLSPTSQARQADTDGCDAELVLVFSVEGTYHGCADTEFPGLFSISSGTRALQKNVRFVPRTRMLEGHEAMEACPVCPDDVQSLGLVSPSTAQIQEVMQEFVTVLPAICGLDMSEVVAEP